MKTSLVTAIGEIDRTLATLKKVQARHLDLLTIRADWRGIRRRLTRRTELTERQLALGKELNEFAFTARAFFAGVTKQQPVEGLKRSRQSDRKSNAVFYAELARAMRKLPSKVVRLLEQQTGKPLVYYRRLTKKWQVADRDIARYSLAAQRADATAVRELARLLGAVGGEIG